MFELVHSSLRVAHDVITPRDQGQPAIVCVPLDVTSDLEIALLASLVTLTPGTLALGLGRGSPIDARARHVCPRQR